MTMKNGILTVSLDFELYWGLRDKRTISEYEANLKGVEKAIGRMLELFDKYEIHATWATVGFLFTQDIEELKALSPKQKPNYHNHNLSPYDYISDSDALESYCHFSPELIDKIRTHKNQEIGTHTFSHYYCLEKGQTSEQFGSDIEAAIEIAKKKDITIKSLVFPRNQWNNEYLSVLVGHGITSYRGNERGWLYKATNESDEKLIRRASRLMDSYFNITGANSYSLKSIGTEKPFNIPSSRFLRPISKRLSLFENLRKQRIIKSLKRAAKNQEVFHLWWHPHNFGVNTDDNIEFLDAILSSFRDMKTQYGMESLNMGEISNLISGEGRA
ncbi:MAG: polysaccharide deacetylase family protein [Methylococcales bacterium]|nr:polysaccharide deacetylase family protein [Methylococcales bacterium]